MTPGNQQSETPDDGPAPDWEALARHVVGESSPDESARIDRWLSGHPQEREILATLDRAMSRLADDVPGDLDIEGALTRVKARRNAATHTLQFDPDRKSRQPASRRPAWRVPFPAIAAAGLLAVGAGSWFALRDSKVRQAAVEPAPRMLATGVGIRDSLTLPDGSQVILGPLSSVRLKSGYGETGREVEVRGDAWFDVVHDDSKPFTVTAGEATIVDLGTKFTVRSDAADGVAVSVTEGSVSLRPANVPAPQGVILKAGDNGVVQKNGQVVARRGTLSDDDTAWMSGKLVFREAPVNEVVASLRRWYGIQITIADASLANRRVTATFKGETPEKMLEVIGLVLGGDIERRGDTAVVRARGGRTQSR
jgi:transmembrane sensor